MKAYLLLLLLLIPTASALQLESPADGAFIPALDTQLTFNATTAADNCTTYLDSSPVQTVTPTLNQKYSAAISSSEGSHSWSVTCLSSGTPTIRTRSFTMDTTAPAVDLITDGVTFNSSKITLSYVPTDHNLANCTLHATLYGPLAQVTTNLSPTSAQSNTFSIEVADGSYEWNAQCTDKAGNSASALFTDQFSVDTTPPIILTTKPDQVVTAKSASLKLTTNEPSTCRYSTQNVAYSQMTQMGITGSTSHEHILSDLSDGAYTYYALCKDGAGNQNTVKPIAVLVHLPPSAALSLNKNDPVGTGIIEVTLTSNKPLGDAPTLTYTETGGSPIPIGLSGSGTSWKGTFVISEAKRTTLATFNFFGVDTSGYAGSTITSGKSFLIDTEPPQAPTELTLKVSANSIALSWAPTEDAISYHVYRRDKPNVGLADLYAVANTTAYTDTSVADKTAYYYRVAAVDSAGNVGELSSEQHATAQADAEPASTDQPLQDYLAFEVTDVLRKVESVQLTVSTALSRMENLEGDTKKAAQALGLIDATVKDTQRLSDLSTQLEALKRQFADETALRSTLASIEQEAAQIGQRTVTSVTIDEQAAQVHVPDEAAQLAALQKSGIAQSMSTAQQDAFLAHNRQALQHIHMESTLTQVRTTTEGGATSTKTIISHELATSSPEPVTESLLLATLPPELADKKLVHLAGSPQAIDGALKWGFYSIGAEAQRVSYVVEGTLSPAVLNDLTLVPLTNINSLGGIETPTGFAIAQGSSGLNIWVIISGVLVIVLLAGYYYVAPTQKREPAIPVQTLERLESELSGMQLEIDEKLYPLMMSIKTSMIKNEPARGTELVGQLLDAAAHYLASGQAERARALYPSIQLLYGALRPDEKRQLSALCMTVYRQLQ